MFQSRVIASFLRKNKASTTIFNTLSESIPSRIFIHEPIKCFSSHSSKKSLFGFYGFRSLSKGNQVSSSFRNMSSVAADKEGLKLLVTAGPRAQKMVGIWLFGSAAWVFSMVVLGGITRLTRSGLSMTDWKFAGSLPPLSDEEWMQEFEKYKQSPEYMRD